jgi:uncharacterized protein (DUF1800 family)
MVALDAPQALHRFGLGPRAGDSARFGRSVREALEADLDGRGDPLLADAGLRNARQAFALFQEHRLLKREAKRLAALNKQRGMDAATPAGPADSMSADGAPDKMEAGSGRTKRIRLNVARLVLRDEVSARLRRVRAAETGFVERLTAFWTNHFTVSAKANGKVRVLAGSYEREAIRPHVLGRFEDMLLAATKHCAMLIYLDNMRSIGPNSRAGGRSKRGLNENHAREIMELHTLGVDGGYTQADVSALARVLTGWSTELRDADQLTSFKFRANWHEPGPQTILGKVYSEPDVTQGEAVLRDLARHPATARHVARKFARAFVADVPPDAVVARLEESFRQSGGDLKELARTLIRSDEAWAGPPTKFKSPQEFLWSAMRGLNLDVPVPIAIRALRNLGHEPWFAPSPAGFPDTTDAWLAPDALTNRLDLAETLAERSTSDVDPRALAEDLLGPSLPRETSETIARAESRKQALALLLMSPDFQRR